MKPNRYNMIEYLINYQFEIVGESSEFLNFETDESWRKDYQLTEEQYVLFKKHAIGVLQKVYKFNRKKAESNFEWFFHEFGLTIKRKNKWKALLDKIGNMNIKKTISSIWKDKKN
jgi:hypothetical protein